MNSCETCRYFAVVPDEKVEGSCRRYPPQIDGYWRWPVVAKFSCCGEWKGKDDEGTRSEKWEMDASDEGEARRISDDINALVEEFPLGDVRRARATSVADRWRVFYKRRMVSSQDPLRTIDDANLVAPNWIGVARLLGEEIEVERNQVKLLTMTNENLLALLRRYRDAVVGYLGYEPGLMVHGIPRVEHPMAKVDREVKEVLRGGKAGT